MKKIIGVFLSIIICSLLVIWNLNVGAEEINSTIISSLSASKTLVKANDKFSISVRIPSGLFNKLAKFKYELTYDAGVFTYLSYSMGQDEKKEETTVTEEITEIDTENKKGVITAVYENVDDEVILDNGVVITFMFEVKPIRLNKSYNFDLSGSDYYDKDGKTIYGSCEGMSIDLFIASIDTKLQSLSISEGTLTPEFRPDITTYTAIVDSSSVKIEATPAPKGRVSNTGIQALKYGENNINLISTAEDGNTMVYKLIITRKDNRNSDNTLKSIDGVSNFDPNITEYNITLPRDEIGFTANAIVNDPKATIRYNPSSKRVALDFGETKKITITVSAENGSKREYILNITRKDDRDSNNLLKSLTISGANINFDPKNISYRVMVDNKYNNTIINAIAQSPTATVTGTGVKTLVEGSNPVNIVVKAENGNEKIYTIMIIRKDSSGKISDLSNNTNLKYLKFNTTNVPLQQGVYNYEISLPNSEEMGEIFYETEDKKAIVSLEGNRDLIVGKNYYRIRVTAENGSTMIYSLTVIRQEIQNFVKNNREAIINALNTSDENNIMVSVEYNDTERIVENSIINALKSSKKTLTYQVFNQEKRLDYSISLNSKDIEKTTPLDFRLKNVTSNQSRIDQLSNAKDTLYINFEGAKEIPGKTKVKMNLKNKFDSKSILTLYYYNDTNDNLELVQDKIFINSDYVEFHINHMGDYILIDSDNLKLSESDSNILLILGGTILGIVLLIVIIILIRRKRNIVKIPNMPKNDETKEETK